MPVLTRVKQLLLIALLQGFESGSDESGNSLWKSKLETRKAAFASTLLVHFAKY